MIDDITYKAGRNALKAAENAFDRVFEVAGLDAAFWRMRITIEIDELSMDLSEVLRTLTVKSSGDS